MTDPTIQLQIDAYIKTYTAKGGHKGRPQPPSDQHYFDSIAYEWKRSTYSF